VKARHAQLADDPSSPSFNREKGLVFNGTAALPTSSRSSSDAALHSTAEAETFARWFKRTKVGGEWRDLLHGIPLSRIYEVADEGRRRATEWAAFASTVEQQVRDQHSLGA
jgi:hypothetical protein